jgi:nucleoside-diphosphate-sugar epimerase
MKIFVTGATGYIGGSVAERLVALGHQVSGLTREASKTSLLKERGIEAVVGTLDDAEILAFAAAAADAVIHTASADHAGSVVTLVSALERTGKTLVHTSGSAVVGDTAAGEHPPTVTYTDDAYFEPIPFRRPSAAMNRFVRQAAIDKGIRSFVICPPMIYGEGRGLNPDSIQIPKLLAFSKKAGAGVYFGKGLNRYSNVYIDDVVDLYVLALEKAAGGSFYFAENGSASFKEIAEMISHSMGFGGKTISVSIEDLVRQSGERGKGVTVNSLVSAVNARRLGWSPHGPSLSEYFESLSKK